MSFAFLQHLFEEQLEFRLEKGRWIVGGVHVYPGDILKTVDPTAYKDQFDKWFAERWFPEQKDLLDQILTADDENENRFSDLCKTLKNDELIPFVGAGMSVPTGLPTWSGFLWKVLRRSKLPEETLRELLSNWLYEEAAEQLAASMPTRAFDEQILSSFTVNKPVRGAVLFLPEIFDKLIITTNLDDLLEQLYETRGRAFSHVLAGQELGEYRRVKATSERVLLKFHGKHTTPVGRVISATEYNAVYAKDSPVRDELATIYKTRSLLYLGCSLGQDRTMSLLEEVAQLNQVMPPHYAFLQHPQDEDLLVDREHFLIDRGIYPIWYPGDHDECITALLAGMLKEKEAK